LSFNPPSWLTICTGCFFNVGSLLTSLFSKPAMLWSLVTITSGSSKGQQINREVISQPVLVVQNVVTNFFKSFRWARKCLLQTEENVRRKKFVSCVVVFIQAILSPGEKQIPSNFTESCSLQKLIYNMQNWNFTQCIIFSEFKKTPPFTNATSTAGPRYIRGCCLMLERRYGFRADAWVGKALF